MSTSKPLAPLPQPASGNAMLWCLRALTLWLAAAAFPIPGNAQVVCSGNAIADRADPPVLRSLREEKCLREAKHAESMKPDRERLETLAAPLRARGSLALLRLPSKPSDWEPWTERIARYSQEQICGAATSQLIFLNYATHDVLFKDRNRDRVCAVAMPRPDDHARLGCATGERPEYLTGDLVGPYIMETARRILESKAPADAQAACGFGAWVNRGDYGFWARQVSPANGQGLAGDESFVSKVLQDFTNAGKALMESSAEWRALALDLDRREREFRQEIAALDQRIARAKTAADAGFQSPEDQAEALRIGAKTQAQLALARELKITNAKYLEALVAAGVASAEAARTAVDRMRAQRYSDATTDLLQFARDEQAGRPRGVSAATIREQRINEQQRAAAERDRRERIAQAEIASFQDPLNAMRAVVEGMAVCSRSGNVVCARVCEKSKDSILDLIVNYQRIGLVDPSARRGSPQFAQLAYVHVHLCRQYAGL